MATGGAKKRESRQKHAETKPREICPHPPCIPIFGLEVYRRARFASIDLLCPTGGSAGSAHRVHYLYRTHPRATWLPAVGKMKRTHGMLVALMPAALSLIIVEAFVQPNPWFPSTGPHRNSQKSGTSMMAGRSSAVVALQAAEAEEGSHESLGLSKQTTPPAVSPRSAESVSCLRQSCRWDLNNMCLLELGGSTRKIKIPLFCAICAGMYGTAYRRHKLSHHLSAKICCEIHM